MAIQPIKYIEITPEVCGGKPRIAGKRITVANIAILHHYHDWSVDDIANDLDLSAAEIYAALSYYHDHKIEIDQSIRDADTLAEQAGTSIDQFRNRIQ